MEIYFIGAVFEGNRTAHKVLNKIEDSQKAYIWYEEGDYAVISINRKGHIRVHSTWAQDSRMEPEGAGLGVLAGGLLGMMFGPAGVLAGVTAGGSIGGIIGHKENVEFTDPQLDAFAGSLGKDTSAIVLLGPDAAIKEFRGELADFEFQEFLTALDDELLDNLKKALSKG